MQTKQAQVSEYQSQNLSLANQTVDLLDRLDARKSLEFDPLKSLQKSSIPLVRRIKPAPDRSEVETNFAPPLDSSHATESGALIRLNLDNVLEGITLSSDLAHTRRNALRNVEPWRADGEFKSALNGKRAAESGRYLSDETRAQTIEIASVRLKKAQQSLDAAGPTKYAQTVRALRDYAVCISKNISGIKQPADNDQFARHLAVDLELMIRAVKNLEKGVNGDLPQVNLQDGFDPLSRVALVSDHLEDKIGRINSNQDKRLDKLVEQNGILAQLQSKLTDLPGDAVIFFFNPEGQIIKAPMSKPGNILVGVDRLEYPKSKLRPDGTFLNREGQPVKVEMTYKAIDVPRWKNAGNGPNGAGIDRFAGDEIVGAAIVRPKDGAKPIQANKRVFVEKEVVGLLGELPSEVAAGMPFKELAKRFGNMEFPRKQITT